MLRFQKDSSGLKLILDQYSQEAVEPYRAMLQTAKVAFVEGQSVLKNNAKETYFKVEPGDVVRVTKMIAVWATCFDDLNHSAPIVS